jgi:hypothetical protein
MTTASIQSLPQDILSYVFLLSKTHEYDWKYRIRTTLLKLFTRRLVLTCQRWKEIIYDDGRFWETDLSISYQFFRRYSGSEADYIDRTEQELQKDIVKFRESLNGSGQSDLNVRLSTRNIRRPNKAERLIADTFVLIAPRSHQLKSLHLSVSPENMGPLIARAFRCFESLPRLESIHFQTYDKRRETFPAGEDKWDLSRAVNLRRLDIFYVYILQNIRPPRYLQALNAQNISSLDIPIPWNEFCDFIAAAPFLQSITLLYLDLDFSLPASFVKMELPHLTSLWFHAPISAYIKLVQTFQLTKLRSLSLVFSAASEASQNAEVDEWIFPHFPTLNKLSLNTRTWTPTVEDFLASTPPAGLKEIEFEFHHIEIRDQCLLSPTRARVPIPPLATTFAATFWDQQPSWILLLNRLVLSNIQHMFIRRVGCIGESVFHRPTPSSESSDNRTQREVELPNLTSLHVQDFGPRDADVFCRHLSAPRLTNVTFKGGFPESHIMQSFPRPVTGGDPTGQDFFAHSLPPSIYGNLTTLSLTVIPGVPSPEPTLSLFPQVVRLCLTLTILGKFDEGAEKVLAPLAPLGGDMMEMTLSRSEKLKLIPQKGRGEIAMPNLEKMMLILQPWQDSDERLDVGVMKEQVGKEGKRVMEGILERRQAIAGVVAGGLRVEMYIQMSRSGEEKEEYWRSHPVSSTCPAGDDPKSD